MVGRLISRFQTAVHSWRWPREVEQAFFGSSIYAWTLRGRAPKALAAIPTQPWPGDARRGAEILSGQFPLGEALSGDTGSAWEDSSVSEESRAFAHGFSWLSDLRTVGSDAARRHGRELMATWMDRNPGWDRFAWRPSLLATRIIHWIAEHDFFCASASDEFRAGYFKSLTRQTRHLFRIAPGGESGAVRFTVIKALFYAVAALPGFEGRMRRARLLLDQEIRHQILADGAHIQRCPSVQLRALRTLIDIRACLAAGGHEIPPLLRSAIDRMAPALRALRHGDGRLALFNGSSEGEAWLVDAVLAQANAPGRAPDELRHAGFQRLKAGRTLILFDAGAPPPAHFDRGCHAGTLSFEMDVGKERLIVNCGASGHGGRWTSAQRTTAAHSTLVVDDTNSSEIREDGSLGRRPRDARSRREEAEGAILLEASHDGYREPFGIVHRRCIYLSADGYDVRGEDSLLGNRPCRFAIRFHLHPAVRSSLLSGGQAALLRLPSGEGWRLQASGAALHLDESIYLGSGENERRAEQLVLDGQSSEGGAVIKWALRRVGPDA